MSRLRGCDKLKTTAGEHMGQVLLGSIVWTNFCQGRTTTSTNGPEALQLQV